MTKCFWCLFSWFLIFLLLLLQTQTGSGSNATSTEVIKLKVGVPKKNGFTQFVNVVWDSGTGRECNVYGYCMEVFRDVLDLLPFKVLPEFEPYVDQSRESAGTYDSLVQQVPALKVSNFLSNTSHMTIYPLLDLYFRELYFWFFRYHDYVNLVSGFQLRNFGP